MNPRICVIGAGPSGISAAKNMLAEGFDNLVVYELSDQVGGNWVFREEESHSSVCETTHIISSKRWSSYEDFPMPDHFPDYPGHKHLKGYFQSYAAHFGVNDYIRSVARQLAAQGYRVCAPDLFWRIEPEVELDPGTTSADNARILVRLYLASLVLICMGAWWIVLSHDSRELAERELVASLEELTETRQELMQSERLATIGQLTATVSHELRNPLAAR